MNYSDLETVREKKLDNKNILHTVLTGYRDCEEDVDMLSHLYFSDKNLKRIQEEIKRQVGIKTRGKYKLEEDQDELDLLVAMKHVYTQTTRFNNECVTKQVGELNKILISYIIPDIVSNIIQEYKYLDEISKPIEPIMRPVNVNNAGRRTLSSYL